MWGKNNEAFEKDNTIGIVKRFPQIMFWSFISGHDFGHLIKISGWMNAYQDRYVLIANLQRSTEEIGIKNNFIFQYDNDPS